ncbi:flavin reductase family protein [Ancylobacter defluvii]|uniref:Flavin reductase like domain-containing protein n=1 Tax=Ancylobacter defluvii TaxID=1282440 RepID=A0A9W6JXY2_9HYPH|nr:flavin reductase family protein [Ancylobacter defluvii]MBS7588664.1 flavin reductase family protein [Ancylobacter defluvii]GLK83944.1 hypothetical protein GCM10017653_20140 [Ancylobacter defluvii]
MTTHAAQGHWQGAMAPALSYAADPELTDAFNHAVGRPALRDAVVSIDCTLAESVDAYTVFFGTVRAVRLGPAAPPLIHFDRGYRSLA